MKKKIQTSTTYTSAGEKKNRDSLIKMFNEWPAMTNSRCVI